MWNSTRRCLWTKFAVLALLYSTAESKKLFMFAGPHNSASSSVEKFFYDYAFNHTRNNKDTFGLKEWRWPHIDGTVARESEPDRPYKIFGHLVTDPGNEVLQNEILEGIREAFDGAPRGIILGTEEFDRVGPESSTDALHAMKKIVNKVSVHPDDVTILLNYRTPRFDQWVSVWKHMAANNEMSYEEFLCDSKYYNDRIEVLATQMNPLSAANICVQQGWSVALVDMGGVAAADRDISHVIACDVLGAHCDDGSVRNHEDDNPHDNEANADFTALSEQQITASEQLLRFRDCAFKQSLSANDRFSVYFDESLWKDCDPKLKEIYETISDHAVVMYKALVSQVSCPKDTPNTLKHKVNMDQVLGGNIPKKAMEPVNPAKQSLQEKNQSGFGLFIEAFLLPMVLVGALGYQGYLMFRRPAGSRYGAAAQNQAAVAEAEMSEIPTGVDAEYGDTGGYHDDEDARKGSYKD